MNLESFFLRLPRFHTPSKRHYLSQTQTPFSFPSTMLLPFHPPNTFSFPSSPSIPQPPHLHPRPRPLITSHFHKLPKSPHLTSKPLSPLSHSHPLLHSSTSRPLNNSPNLSLTTTPDDQIAPTNSSKKSFWAAVGLIIGTAVGPGMLALPSATIKSGTIPSTMAIILSWVYVVSSIILVAELSFAAMRETQLQEVSFTSLATSAFGSKFGAFVAIIYSCLSFALVIACVSGIGSLVVEQFPFVHPIVAHSLVPGFVGIVIGFFPFKAIDVTNRLLCVLMLFSIATLVLIGLSVGRSNMLGSLSFASWRLQSIMPAIPVTVLTLGFHVITPFVCRIVGDSVHDARKAILFGGAVPLAMVLSWNAVVLGLTRSGNVACEEPIKLLLSVSLSALPAVKGFAFAALATSLIGYAVSFPKQLVDTIALISEGFHGKEAAVEVFSGDPANDFGNDGRKWLNPVHASSSWNGAFVTWIVLVAAIFIASFFPAAFSKALDFAGVYANCFLFGILPPAMAWILRSRKTCRLSTPTEDLLPGGNVVLRILFLIAVILGFWH